MSKKRRQPHVSLKKSDDTGSTSSPRRDAAAGERMSPATVSWARRVWGRIRDFSGIDGASTYLWPRWLVLRAVGVVFVIIFGGVIVEAKALIAPDGIAQLAEFLQSLRKFFPSPVAAFIHAPSLFWIDTGSGAIGVLAWGGMAAAIALVLNLWPRLALFVCWLFFLSFTTTWRVFSPAQLDNLMLETALLCIPFAPAGFRPGLGERSPPRPIAVFMMRWLLFRVMFESGLVKLTSGDPYWRDLSAMDVMYQTSPFPTIFGYWDHNLPHWYHVFEILLTFVAELAAPLVAVFGGRRGRWLAFGVWTIFQAGIQLTNNFGWLNTASIGLGLLLLDDQMIQAATRALGLRRFAGSREPVATPSATSVARGWKTNGLRVALWAHFGLTLFYFARAWGIPVKELPSLITGPVDALKDFRSANGYYLYATIESVRYQVEFIGSNDNGQTWRPYPFRNIPQREDEICGFIAPWFSRFEATMEIEGGGGRKSPVFPAVAGHLLVGNPAVVKLFRNNPFPEAPPGMIRMRGYRLFFTDRATRRVTGNFWRREPAGDYSPLMYRDPEGRIAEFNLAPIDAMLAEGNFAAAFDTLERQYKSGCVPAGFRLAELFARGMGGRSNPARAHAIYSELAAEGEVGAEHYLGICHEYGIGVPINFEQAAAYYRKAAGHGYMQSLFSLGSLYARDRIGPRNDVVGLSLLLEAAARAVGDDPVSRFIRENEPAQAKLMTDRMTPAEIAEARKQASTRLPIRKSALQVP